MSSGRRDGKQCLRHPRICQSNHHGADLALSLPQAGHVMAGAVINQYIANVAAARRGGRMNGDNSLFERAASENWSPPERGVEAKERHRGHQQNPGQTDARIPRRALRRQGKVRQEIAEEQSNHQP